MNQGTKTITVGVPAESAPGENRVAATPDSVARLVALGFEVAVERGAGVRADFPDAAFEAAGASVVDGDAVWSAPVVIKVNPPSDDEVARLAEGTTLVSMIRPAQNRALVDALVSRKVDVVALDCVPRISRAQKMDVLSSMANIAGYRAVLEAAHAYGGFFTGQITAAGKTPPARVLVIGAGVAGLSAIATARGLGAEVRAFDVRESVADQVKSLGGRFLRVDIKESGEGIGGYARTMSEEYIAAEMALFLDQCREVDIVITTALIPGKPAPQLITGEMLQALKPGSVVVDLAAEAGGNCEGTVAGEIVRRHDVTIIGYTDLTSRLPRHASQFFASNLVHLLDEMGGGSGFGIDMDNDAVRGAVVARGGELTWPAPPVEPSAPKTPAAASSKTAIVRHERGPNGRQSATVAFFAAALIAGVGQVAPAEFLAHFTVFVLSIFVGWQVIWNVTPALHTPLMSVTNAISGIIVVGGLLTAGSLHTSTVAAVLGAVAVFVATINIAGGFLVTQRMLAMFRK